MPADGRGMPTLASRFAIAAIGASLTLLLAACGSSSGSPSTPQPSRLAATQKAQDKVLAMVPTPTTSRLHAAERWPGEAQRPAAKKGTPHYAVANQLVRASWLASEHSIVIRSADGHAAIVSDANLFKSEAAAARIWTLRELRGPRYPDQETSNARRRPRRREVRVRDQRQAGRVPTPMETRLGDRLRLPRCPPGRDVLAGRPHPHRRVHLDGRTGPGSPHRERPGRRPGVLAGPRSSEPTSLQRSGGRLGEFSKVAGPHLPAGDLRSLTGEPAAVFRDIGRAGEPAPRMMPSHDSAAEMFVTVRFSDGHRHRWRLPATQTADEALKELRQEQYVVAGAGRGIHICSRRDCHEPMYVLRPRSRWKNSARNFCGRGRRVQGGPDGGRLRQGNVQRISGQASCAGGRPHCEAGHRHHHGADPGRPAPKLVTIGHGASTRPGSVIVDLAVERGGNVEGVVAGRSSRPPMA